LSEHLLKLLLRHPGRPSVSLKTRLIFRERLLLLRLLVCGLGSGENVDEGLLVLAFLIIHPQVLEGALLLALVVVLRLSKTVLKIVEQVKATLLLLFLNSSPKVLRKYIATTLFVPRHAALCILIDR